MRNELSCPICNESVYSIVGFGCKMCGMPLEDNDKEFCSMDCEDKYESINE